MFRVIELQNGKIEVHEGSERVGPPPPGVTRWIDLRDQDDAQLELLRSRFDLHPLAIEDCAHLDQRPKLEEYRDHIFLVTQGFSCPGERVRELNMHELHTFLGERCMITVHTGDIAALDRAWRRVSGDARPLERGVDFVYYLIADGIVDDIFPLLDRIADELEEIEDAVLASPKHKDLGRIFELKHHLVQMRKVLSPQRDVLGVLAKRGDARVSERTALYLRDVYDHLVRINESIESNRDLLGNALEAYLSAVAQRTNEIMKHLTIMSAVFLPLAFIVGFFGQNFDNLPGAKDWIHSDTLMWTMIVLCAALPIGMFSWFFRKGWL
ncbi:MAG: magnesium/cobalt transporter CorA [Deltaproteobacteria bacterium]|nr:magnesium/cobalt transporter CorA [Deltaproteobacteria bacterium]